MGRVLVSQRWICSTYLLNLQWIKTRLHNLFLGTSPCRVSDISKYETLYAFHICEFHHVVCLHGSNLLSYVQGLVLRLTHALERYKCFYCTQYFWTRNECIELYCQLWSRGTESGGWLHHFCLPFFLAIVGSFSSQIYHCGLQTWYSPASKFLVYAWLFFCPIFQRMGCWQGHYKDGLISLEPFTILFCVILDSFWISPLFACTFSLKAPLPMVLNNVISNTSFPFIPL